MTIWEKVARKVNEECGAYVDWDERFFECPECGEPIYECDYNDFDDYGAEDSDDYICPVCENEIAERR